jgi:hypothetical protein
MGNDTLLYVTGRIISVEHRSMKGDEKRGYDQNTFPPVLFHHGLLYAECEQEFSKPAYVMSNVCTQEIKTIY